MKPFARILDRFPLPPCVQRRPNPRADAIPGVFTDLDGTLIQCGAVDDCPSGPYSLTRGCTTCPQVAFPFGKKRTRMW